MDDTELHYLTYDPDAIMEDMMTAYMEAGGDVLYAGDEKEMLLRAVLAIMTQAFAGIDNALRMDTLRYAVRDYLDVYGEKRGCERIQAQAATATVSIICAATGTARTIEAGTSLTEDGSVLFALAEDLTLTGYEQTVTADIVCQQAGSIGNGLLAGANMQFLVPVDGVVSVTCTASGSGGQDAEEDEAYRERIRTYGLTRVSTGPSQQYEAVARAVSSEIIDAKALNTGDGEVTVYILPRSQTGIEALLEDVENALSGESVRPLTDSVSAEAATAVEYTLNVRYSADSTGATQAAIAAAVSEYSQWQEQTIGRPFNPDKLAALMYQAGATRVIWGEGSEFDGGSVEYTEIEPSEYCSGSITLAVIDT